jgi:hypothetical protein
MITGFAINGLDSSTIDPICDFTCIHGFCPKSACDEALLVTPASDQPTSTEDLEPFASSVSYGAGDFFVYENPGLEGMELVLTLLGTAQTWDDINCGGVAAIGPDGNTLGCIAMAMAVLYYAEVLGAGTALDQGIATRSLPSSDFHFQFHPEWQPEKNCTTRCKLTASGRTNSLVPIGNGTYNGIPHTVHFFHNETLAGHRVIQNPSSGNYSAGGAFNANDNVYWHNSGVWADKAWQNRNGLINYEEYLTLDDPAPQDTALWMGEST